MAVHSARLTSAKESHGWSVMSWSFLKAAFMGGTEISCENQTILRESHNCEYRAYLQARMRHVDLSDHVCRFLQVTVIRSGWYVAVHLHERLKKKHFSFLNFLVSILYNTYGCVIFTDEEITESITIPLKSQMRDTPDWENAPQTPEESSVSLVLLLVTQCVSAVVWNQCWFRLSLLD